MGRGSQFPFSVGVMITSSLDQFEVRTMTTTVRPSAIQVQTGKGDVRTMLLRYKALDVNEVWIWEDGALRAYHLQAGDYQKVNRSLIPALATLDLQVMSDCILLGETSRLKAGKKLLSTVP